MTALLESPLALRHQPAWKTLGACNGRVSADTDWWLPSDELPAVEQARQRQLAVAVCRSCPVRDVCLRDALVTGERWSVRGATTPEQRRRIARQHGFPRPSPDGATQCGTRAHYIAGCRLPRCTEANARYVSGWRARRSSVTRALKVVVHELVVPSGAGRRRAFPGQLYLDLLEAAS